MFLFHTINSTKLRKWQNVVAWLFFQETKNYGCMDGNKKFILWGQGVGGKIHSEKYVLFGFYLNEYFF